MSIQTTSFERTAIRSYLQAAALIAVCSVFFWSEAGQAEVQQDKESPVKAAIIYNLARFSEWPEPVGNSDPDYFWLCAQTDNPMVAALATIADRPIHGLTLKVKLLEDVRELANECQAVFLSAKDIQKVDLLAIARGGVLSISDGEDFLDLNGAIHIRRVGSRLGFAINRKVMDLANISMSSKVLSLAVEVRR